MKEFQGIARDVAIAGWRHVSPLRGKGWVIHDWGLVRTCAGILRVSIGMSFGVFLQFLLYPYNYNYELYINYICLMNHLMSQWEIFVKLMCSCVECEP